MVRLALAFAVTLLASPGAAACFGPTLPDVVEFDGGRVVTILAHNGRDLTYRARLPDGSETVSTVRQGLFPVTTSHAGVTIRYDWQDPLPKLAGLQPGQVGSLRADMVIEQAHRSFLVSDYRVLRADVVTVGPCTYPVVVVERTDKVDGQTQAVTTLWLSREMGFPLRTEATANGKRFAYGVTDLR